MREHIKSLKIVPCIPYLGESHKYMDVFMCAPCEALTMCLLISVKRHLLFFGLRLFQHSLNLLNVITMNAFHIEIFFCII